MPEEITPDITKRVAELSRLELSDSEVERFSVQLSLVLQHAKDIEALDLTDVEPTSHPYPLKNVLREDDLHEDLEDSFRADVLEAAPNSENNQFKVPPILSEE